MLLLEKLVARKRNTNLTGNATLLLLYVTFSWIWVSRVKKKFERFGNISNCASQNYKIALSLLILGFFARQRKVTYGNKFYSAPLSPWLDRISAYFYWNKEKIWKLFGDERRWFCMPSPWYQPRLSRYSNTSNCPCPRALRKKINK